MWWESQNEIQKDPEETTLYWEAGEVSWSRPRNLSAALEKQRSGKRRLEKHGCHFGAREHGFKEVTVVLNLRATIPLEGVIYQIFTL